MRAKHRIKYAFQSTRIDANVITRSIYGHPIFQSWWTPAVPASTTQNIVCPSIMTRLKMGKTNHPIVYSLTQGTEHGSLGRAIKKKKVF